MKNKLDLKSLERMFGKKDDEMQLPTFRDGLHTSRIESGRQNPIFRPDKINISFLDSQLHYEFGEYYDAYQSLLEIPNKHRNQEHHLFEIKLIEKFKELEIELPGQVGNWQERVKLSQTSKGNSLPLS